MKDMNLKPQMARYRDMKRTAETRVGEDTKRITNSEQRVRNDW